MTHKNKMMKIPALEEIQNFIVLDYSKLYAIVYTGT